MRGQSAAPLKTKTVSSPSGGLATPIARTHWFGSKVKVFIHTIVARATRVWIRTSSIWMDLRANSAFPEPRRAAGVLCQHAVHASRGSPASSLPLDQHARCITCGARPTASRLGNELSAHHRPILNRLAQAVFFERQGYGVSLGFPAGAAADLPFSVCLPRHPRHVTLSTQLDG